jgi:hypothetical protein
MSLPHYSAWKIATWILSLAGAVIVTLDPTVKVAIIVAIPSTITGIGTLILGFMSRKSQQITDAKVEKIEISVNSNTSRLLDKLEEKGKQLVAATSRADSSEGSEAGRQLARTEASEDKAKS